MRVFIMVYCRAGCIRKVVGCIFVIISALYNSAFYGNTRPLNIRSGTEKVREVTQQTLDQVKRGMGLFVI